MHLTALVPVILLDGLFNNFLNQRPQTLNNPLPNSLLPLLHLHIPKSRLLKSGSSFILEPPTLIPAYKSSLLRSMSYNPSNKNSSLL